MTRQRGEESATPTAADSSRTELDQRLEGSSSKRSAEFLEEELDDGEDDADDDEESLLPLWLPGSTFCTA